MPKELFEIKKFDKGILSTPSHEDIPTEAASYSLDLEVTSVDGKLQGRKDDVQLVADKGKIDKAVFIDNPDNTKKDLIYISDDNLKSSADFYGSTAGGEADVDHGDIGASGSNSMIVNNKEVHIGTGNTEISNTKWIGYTQSTQFDEAIEEKIIENDELALITTLPSFSQSIEDANHIFAVNQDGTKIVKVDKASYTFEESDYTFEKITAICLQGPKSTNGITGQNLWVYDSNRGGENAPGGIGLIQRSNLSVKRWEDITTDYGKTSGFIVSDMIDNQEYLHIAFFKDNTTLNYVGPYFNSTLKNELHDNGEVEGTASGHEDNGGKLKITTTIPNDLNSYFEDSHPYSTNGTRHDTVGMDITISGAGLYDGNYTISEVEYNTITFTGVAHIPEQDITELKWSMPGVPTATHKYNGEGDLKCFPLMARITQTSGGGGTSPYLSAASFTEAHPIANNQALEARAIRNDGSGNDDVFEHGYYSTLGNIYKSENAETEQDYHDVYLFAQTLQYPFVPANNSGTYASGKTKASFYYMFKELKNGTDSTTSSDDEIHVTIYDDGGTPTNRAGRPPGYDFYEYGNATNPAPYQLSGNTQSAQTDNYECWTKPIKSATQKNLTGILMMSNWSNDGTRAWNAWDRVDHNNVPSGGATVGGHGCWWVSKRNYGGSDPTTMTTRYDDDHNISNSLFGTDTHLQVQFGKFGIGGGSNNDEARALNHNKWGQPNGGEEDLNGLAFPGNITTFADGPNGDASNTTITMSDDHGLSTDDKINIYNTDNYDGRELVVTVSSTTEFSIEKPYVVENEFPGDKTFRIPSYPITYYITNLGLDNPDDEFLPASSSGGSAQVPMQSIPGIGSTLAYTALGDGRMKILQDFRRIPMGHILSGDITEGVNGRTFYPIEDRNYMGGTKTFYDYDNSYKDAEGSCAIMMPFKYDDNDVSGSWDLQSKNDNISQFLLSNGTKADYIFTGESSNDDLLHQAFFPDIWSSGKQNINHVNKFSYGGGVLQQPRGLGIISQDFTDVTMTQITDVADNLSIQQADYGDVGGDTAMFSTNVNTPDARIHVWDNTRLMSFEQIQGDTQGSGSDDPGTFSTGTARAQSLLVPTLTQSVDLKALPGLLEDSSWSTFGFSFEYDGYQEGPISAIGSKEQGAYIDEEDKDEGEQGFFINLELKSTGLSKRITAVNVYVAESFDASPGQGGLFRLITRVPTESGWLTGSHDFWGNTYTLREEFQWRGQRSSTYESLTGIPEAIKRTMVNYNLSTELNNTLFVTDIYHQDLVSSGNYVIKSLPYKYSMFDVLHDRLILPEKPTAITSFAGRVWVFSENNTYKIEPNNFYIEDTFNGVGCASQNSLVVTEYGMCFADSNNVYLHDGNIPQPIGEPILKIEYSSTDYGYKSMYDSSGFKPFVLFDGTRNSFMIIMSNRHALTFNVLRKKWDLWTTPGSITTQAGTPDFYTAFNSKDGTIHMSKKHDEAGSDVIPLFTYANHATDEMPWKWVSKTLTMGQSTQDKKFYESNLIGTGLLTELEGDNGSLNPNGFPHKSRSLKVTVEGDEGSTVDAIGLIFRRYIKVFKGVSG